MLTTVRVLTTVHFWVSVHFVPQLDDPDGSVLQNRPFRFRMVGQRGVLHLLAAHPSGSARCGAGAASLAIKYQSLWHHHHHRHHLRPVPGLPALAFLVMGWGIEPWGPAPNLQDQQMFLKTLCTRNTPGLECRGQEPSKRPRNQYS